MIEYSQGERVVVIRDEFFLTGGTALAALYLHHRYSLDLGLFTEDPTAIAQGPPKWRAILSGFCLRTDSTRRSSTQNERLLQTAGELIHP
jgi:hypothetical protein